MSLEKPNKEFASYNATRTICEKLRVIYWAVKDPNVRSVVEEAYNDAKRMNKKLREYKADWEKEMMWRETDTEEARAEGEARLAQYEAERDAADAIVNARIRKYDKRKALEQEE